jgi:hypothetical protein
VGSLTTAIIALVFFCETSGEGKDERPDIEGARRLDKAIELFNSSLADFILISGGCVGTRDSIHLYVDYLKDRNIPDDVIITDKESDTTASNLFHSAKIIENLFKQNIEIEKIWLISNFRHLRRIDYLIWWSRHSLKADFEWPWASQNAEVEISKKASPMIVEFLKLVVTIIDPGEESKIVRYFKKKRERRQSFSALGQ